VDCPGHASLIRTIIGGAQIIDLMLLVIDITKVPPFPVRTLSHSTNVTNLSDDVFLNMCYANRECRRRRRSALWWGRSLWTKCF
jgi:hypothetical protein